MLTEIHIVCESEDQDDFTIKDQDGDYLQDAQSLEIAINKAKKFAQIHDLDRVILHLDHL